MDTEIRTDERGRPLDRVEANIALCLHQGRIAANEIDAVRHGLEKNYERTMGQLLARPVSRHAAVASRSLSEEMYADYARRSGVPGYAPKGYVRSIV
jgi:hypothetical protein